MEKKIYDLTIDPELEGLIPPLHKAELSMLTESLLANGCEMPLLVWNGVIVDGHNRYRICLENGIPFAVEEKIFDSRDAAKVWIIMNQLGRRNLTDFCKIELVYPLEKLEKAKAKERQGERTDLLNIPPTLAGCRTSCDTRDKMARLAGVSHGTYDKGKKIIDCGDEKTKDDLRKGKDTINGAYTRILKKEKEKSLAKSMGSDARSESPAAADSPAVIPQSDPERPKFESLLDKPIFDRNQRTQIDGPIIFQPVVSEESMAAFKAAKQKEEAALSVVDTSTDAPSDHDIEANATETVEQDVQELIDDFLDGLSSVLDDVGSADAKRILEMVRDAGERAVHTVEIYMRKMED